MMELFFLKKRLCSLVNARLGSKYTSDQEFISETHHVYSTLKRSGNSRLHVVSTWNTRGVFVAKFADKI